MKNSAIQQVLKTLQHVVNNSGYNYEITLGFDEYSLCTTWEDFFTKLKTSYPEADIKKMNFLPSTEKEFWQIVDETLLLDGDLKPGSIAKVRPLVLEFKQAFLSLITPFTEFHHSDLPKGVPGYPVWWDFSFVIDTKSGSFLFFYGSASD